MDFYDKCKESATFYFVDFVEKDYEWCYSSKELCRSLNALFQKESIQKMLVPAKEYFDPLRVKMESHVNYWSGPLLLWIGDRLLDFYIHATGLFEWRVYEKGEYTIRGPESEPSQEKKDYCDVGDGYGVFKAEYCGCAIEKIEVKNTNCWMLPVRGFDATKVASPVDLPEVGFFFLSNGQVLSLHGWDDDFAIKLANKDVWTIPFDN